MSTIDSFCFILNDENWLCKIKILVCFTLFVPLCVTYKVSQILYAALHNMTCENSFLSNEQNKTFIALALLEAMGFCVSFHVFITVSGALYLF